MRSLGARFKRLKDWQFKNREVKLVLIRDQRLPISKTAVATRSHLQSLEEKGAVLTQPDAETLAALQALRSLLSDAKSGDLHYQGETLAPRTVQEWLCRNLDPSLTSFLGNIVEVSEHESDADSEVMGPTGGPQTTPDHHPRGSSKGACSSQSLSLKKRSEGIQGW
jgi:hypothetical protein